VESNQNVESKTKNVESKNEKCGVQNSIKIVATRCHILRLKCTKIQNSAGALPQTPLGSLQRSSRALAGFKGGYFKGEGREWRGLEGAGYRRGREGRGVVESKKSLK